MDTAARHFQRQMRESGEKNYPNMDDHFENEEGYVALTAIADVCLRSDPPRIRQCIHCLEATFRYKLPPLSEAHIRVQLGNILLKYTENDDLARSHFERSVCSHNYSDYLQYIIKGCFIV